MGLDVAVIRQEFLRRPKGVLREFAWELVEEANAVPLLYNDGGVWAEFNQRQVMRLRDQFVASRQVTPDEAAEIDTWVRSLPWDDWQPQTDPHEWVDPEGGIIQLFFNW